MLNTYRLMIVRFSIQLIKNWSENMNTNEKQILNTIPLFERRHLTDDCVKTYKSKEERKEDSLIPCVYDRMFKIILGNENRKRNTAYFLSLVLNKDMKEIEDNLEYKNTILENEKVEEAQRIVDLIVKIDGKYINVELNNSSTPKKTLNRNIDFANRIFAHKRKQGTSYEYDKVLQISLNNFYFEGMPLNEIQHNFGYYSDDHKYKMTDVITFKFFYLPLVKKKYYNGEKLTELEKLLLILTSEHIGDYPDILEGNEMLQNIQKEVYDASVSDEELIAAYNVDVYKEFEAQWKMEEATAKGKSEEKLSIAIAMLKNNISIEMVCNCTGLSIEQVKELKKDLK